MKTGQDYVQVQKQTEYQKLRNKEIRGDILVGLSMLAGGLVGVFVLIYFTIQG